MTLHHICHRSYPASSDWSCHTPWQKNSKEELLGSCHDLFMVYVQMVSTSQTATAPHDRTRVKNGEKWLWASSRYYLALPGKQEHEGDFYIINLTWHYECYLHSWISFRVWRNMRCAVTTSFTGWVFIAFMVFMVSYVPCHSTRQAQTLS